MKFQNTTPIALGLLFVLLPGVPAYAQLVLTGVIRAEKEVIVQSEYAGVAEHIAVKEGDVVTEGQLLVELKNERHKIALELARTGLARANALVDETRAVLENAEREAGRLRIAAGALPRKDLENIEDQILRVKAGLTAQIADRSRAEQEVRMREQELKETRLVAPFSGTVTEVFITRGESLRPIDTPVLELVALDNLYAEVLLPSRYVRNITAKQQIAVQVENEWMGRPGQLTGQIIYIKPTIDAASRTFKVKVGIPNTNGLVRPGMLAQVRFD
jgi:membrane fusion protein (multidrug efflux system)